MSIPQWFHESADRMIALTLFSGLVGASGFVALFAPPRFLSHRGLWPGFAGAAVLSLGGMLLMVIAGSNLRDEVRNERWPPQQLQLWYKRTHSRSWTAFTGLLLLLMLAALVVSSVQHRFGHGYLILFWPLFVVVQTLSQVTGAFRKKANSGNNNPLHILQGWKKFGELRSEHWGQR